MEKKEFLSVREAAEIINVSEQVIRRLLDDGEIPGRKINPDAKRSRWLVSRQGLEEWAKGESKEAHREFLVIPKTNILPFWKEDIKIPKKCANEWPNYNFWTDYLFAEVRIVRKGEKKSKPLGGRGVWGWAWGEMLAHSLWEVVFKLRSHEDAAKVIINIRNKRGNIISSKTFDFEKLKELVKSYAD